MRETTDALGPASFLNSQGRLARVLPELAALLGENSGDGGIILAHEIRELDLAAMAGIAREKASRIIGEWKRRELVTRLSVRWSRGSVGGSDVVVPSSTNAPSPSGLSVFPCAGGGLNITPQWLL